MALESWVNESGAGAESVDKKERLKSPFFSARSPREVDKIGDSTAEDITAGRLSGLSDG